MLLIAKDSLDTRQESGPTVAMEARDSHASTKTGAERRRGLRIAQTRPIKIFEQATHRYYGGQTEDLSATGLRIELPLNTPVVPGTLVNLHIGLNQIGEALANRRSMIAARIVWVCRKPNLTTGFLTAGVEFMSSITAHKDAA